MSTKSMLPVVIASMLMTLCASYTYMKKSTFSNSACTTALGHKFHVPQSTCLPNGKSNNVLEYIKADCNTTHAFAKVYSDKTCATENTTKSATYMNQASPVACTAAGSSGQYEKFTCGQATSASTSVAVVMRFDASGCADAAFEQFEFYELDACSFQSGATPNTWEKWTCNGTTLQRMYYSDSTCTTNTSATPIGFFTGGGTCAVKGGMSGSSSGGDTIIAATANTTTAAPGAAAATTTAGANASASGATTTTVNTTNATNASGGRRLLESEEEGGRRMRRLQSSSYYKIYEACGNVKPTLPAGAGTVPSTASGGSGNMAGAQRFATMHSMAAALVAAVFVVLS